MSHRVYMQYANVVQHTAAALS